MKSFRIFFTVIIAVVAISYKAAAVPAYPGPITVTQPDGTTLVIRIHGDEFLHWTTCGNSLVTKGDDGFYHYAAFGSDGITKASGSRVTATLSGDGSSVRPPEYLIRKAQEVRKNWEKAADEIRKSASRTTNGETHFLVLLAEFSDLSFKIENPTIAFSNLLNSKGYSEYGATGSVKDYYVDQSRGLFNPHFDVYGPYQAPNSVSYYGKDKGEVQETGAPRLLVETCQSADKDVDFSIYDADGDGYIDNVFMYYAGYNAAEGAEGTIWPHQWCVFYRDLILDGVKLYQYACSSELKGTKGVTMTSIGTFCHEYGHSLGLPDFYDTDYDEHGKGYGLGKYSLMSSGNYNNNSRTPPYLNCEERHILGWIDDIPELPRFNTNVSLSPIYTNSGYISPTENEGEYYYYEYRNGMGWDAPLEPGLIIYHIDKSENIVDGISAHDRWLYGNGINANSKHQCFKLVQANEKKEIIPFGGDYPEFSAWSKPAALDWSEQQTGYNLYDISTDFEKATFTLKYGKIDNFYEKGICAIETAGDWKSGDVFTFKLAQIETNPSSVIWSFDGNKITSDSVTLTSGHHTIKAEVSWDNGDSGYYEAAINVK